MAARAPTTWTNWPDGDAVRAQQPIVETEPDNWHNDLEFIHDAEQLGMSTCFRPVKNTGTNATWCHVKTWQVKFRPNLDGTGVRPTIKWTAYVWTDGSVGVTVRVTTSAGATTDTKAASGTPAWTAMGHGGASVYAYGTLETITLEIQTTGEVSGDVYCAGFGLYVEEL